MFSSTFKAPLAPVSSSAAATELIFIKAVVLPEWFLKFTWFLLCRFTSTTTVKAVAMAIALASMAALSLFFNIKSKKPLIVKFTESEDDFIEMIDISAVSHVAVNKKPLSHFTPDNEPFGKKKILPLPSAPVRASPSTVNVGYLLTDSSYAVPTPARRMSYADAVGYDHMETRKPRNPNILGYDVYLGDLFPDSSYAVPAPARRMSYADAVGYDHMETRKPRNPNILGYDVYLGDLFPDSSYAVPEPARRMSYSDAVGYGDMVTKPRGYCHTIEPHVYLGDFIREGATNVIHSPPFRRLSYAEAVGYANMTVDRH